MIEIELKTLHPLPMLSVHVTEASYSALFCFARRVIMFALVFLQN